ncbi:hypothetical protein CEXT_544011 [Caerostris extrusa]|uniref:Uncharacterized protein n=1 Tax=Caerostris extrusa TaxID=172846 RepID=A0AAV4SKC0_CAEEX|nr:hypothetical protein CEXT_544011 [Caerostris extrusa]
MFVEKTTQSLPIGSFCGVRNHEFSSAEMIWERGELFGRRVWAMLSGLSGNQSQGAETRNNIQTSHSSLGPVHQKRFCRDKIAFSGSERRYPPQKEPRHCGITF